MGLITHTNIVVDNFNYGKVNPYQHYVYFLTHFHSDHWVGLTPSWNYGKIYCSAITKRLILNKFPNISNVEGLEVNTPYTIFLNPSKTLQVEVFAFDANHCPGAVMFLFRGYMGTIIHTGDFRFHKGMITDNPVLYPLNLRTPDFAKCSIHVDEVIFDNTFCDPVFKFPPREKALKDLIEIIDKNKDKRVLLSTDCLGKEEIFIQLAEHYQTLIVVNESRYSSILAMDMRPELFTTNKHEGWIEVITKDSKWKRLKEFKERVICITPTGWVNHETYSSPDGIKYIVPYSAHSNFEEMETFVRSINPAILKCVVRNKKSAEDVENIREFTSYMVTLMHLKQKGYELFVKYYTAPDSLSEEYKTWLKPENKSQLEIELGLKIPEEKQLEINTFLFERKHKDFFEKKKTIRMGAKFKEVQHNPNLSHDEILTLQKSPKTHKSSSLPQESSPRGVPELKKSRSALEQSPPKESQETQKLSEDEEENQDISEDDISTDSYRDGSKFAFSMIRSGSVSPLLSVSGTSKSPRTVSPIRGPMEIESTPVNFEDEYRYTEAALNARAYNPADDLPSQNKKRSQSPNGSAKSVIQIEETTSPLSRKNSTVSAPGTIEKSLEIIQQPQTPPPIKSSLLSEYIQHQVKDKRIINQIRLKEKNEQLKKSTSLPPDLVESRAYVPKTDNQNAALLHINDIQNMTPEEYMRDKQKRETQAIDLIRKLQGNKPRHALPKHFQKFMNNNDIPTDDLVLQDDVFGFGQRSPAAAVSPRMGGDSFSMQPRSPIMASELPDNFVFNESSLPRGGIRKSLSAEDADSSNSLRNNKKKVLPNKSKISDTPQFGNSQETNSGENSRGRMEIEPLNKEQFAKVMREKHEASKKALEEKKRKIIERNKKELWDDMEEEEEKPKPKSTKPSPVKPVVYQRRQPNPEPEPEIFSEEEGEKRQLKGQIINVATRKTDSLRTVQKVLGLQNMEEIEPMPLSRSPTPSPRNSRDVMIEKKNSNENIIKKKVSHEEVVNNNKKKVSHEEIISQNKKKSSHEEIVMYENRKKTSHEEVIQENSNRKRRGERNVGVSVESREETAHFRVEIGDDLKTPHVHIYSSKSKVHLQLSHSPAKGSKEKPPPVIQREESEEEEIEYEENSDHHDEWLGPYTQDEFTNTARKSQYFNNEPPANKSEDTNTNSSALSFSNKKLFKPKLNEKAPVNVMTFSQINPNVPAAPKILISGKSPSKNPPKLPPKNHDNWLDIQDSQESLQNDSSEHSLMETLRVPPPKTNRRQAKPIIEEEEESEEEEKEVLSLRNKASIPSHLFTKQAKKDKGKYFHDDWLESYESAGAESKKSTPGKHWQQHLEAPKKVNNVLADKLIQNDKKFQEKKSQPQPKKPPPQEKSDEDSFGFDAEPVVLFEGDERMLVSDRRRSSQTSGKMSFGKSTYQNLMGSEEEEEEFLPLYRSQPSNSDKKSSEPKQKYPKKKELEIIGTLEEPIDVDSLPVKRKRGRPRKVQPEEERIVSLGNKIDLTPIDLFKDCGIYPLKKVKKTPKVKPLQQNAEENLRKLLDVFIDKKSFQ